jgi:putative membrane protein
MYGFVYKDESFPENTILVSRLLITCCAADATLVGFHVKVENADDFVEDEWIEVTGAVDKFKLNYYGKEYEFPIITDGTVIKCEKPELSDWYVYP